MPGTKYFGGHSDLLCGVLVVKSKNEWNEVRVSLFDSAKLLAGILWVCRLLEAGKQPAYGGAYIDCMHDSCIGYPIVHISCTASK